MSNSVNKVLLVDGAQSDDGLSLVDLMTFVRRHRVGLIGGAIIGGALGLTAALGLPAEWEVSTLVRIGQVGTAIPIEQPLTVVERVKQKSFKDGVMRRIGASGEESNPKASLLSRSLKVKVEKPDLIGVRVRGASPGDAERFVNGVIAELAMVHTKMAQPTLKRWLNEAEEVNLELQRLGSETVRIRSQLEGQAHMKKNDSTFPIVSASYVLMLREAELRSLRERKRVLEEQLSPEKTYATSPLSGIYVATQPVSPNKSFFTVAGLVAGLFVGGLLSVVRSRV